jgi:hypothetical protein
VSVASLTSSWEAVLSVPLVREAERESTWFWRKSCDIRLRPASRCCCPPGWSRRD